MVGFCCFAPLAPDFEGAVAFLGFVVVVPLGLGLGLSFPGPAFGDEASAGPAFGGETSTGPGGWESSRAALLGPAAGDSPFLLRFALVEKPNLLPVVVLAVDEVGVSDLSLFSMSYGIRQFLVSSHKRVSLTKGDISSVSMYCSAGCKAFWFATFDVSEGEIVDLLGG